ncbi:MAG: AMP-binding protein [Chloroflexi bacterium]|nr:AMP-binding protein [Chloroflexota bacterium]MCY4246887.1 AMP-binding protein [Chloroflexota bacterium]
MFLDAIAANCRAHPQKTAILFLGGEAVSYAQLAQTTNRTAHYLRALGIDPGDRVAAQLPKCLPFITLHLAAMQIGAVFLPLNPGYPPAELRYFLADAGARLLFADRTKQAALTEMSASLPALQEAIFIDADAPWSDRVSGYSANPVSLPVDPDQTAMMLYTSGTTSRPKGALITHGNLTANIEALHSAWGWRADDLLLHALPIFHVHGLVVALHGALHAGATAELLPDFDAAAVLDLLQSRRYSVFMGVPTMHRRLYAQAAGTRIDLSFMRLLTSGSDRLPDDLFFGYQRSFGVTLLERYGMTETGMNLSNPLHGERRVGSVGMPLPGVRARIADPATDLPLPDDVVGEVQISGAHVFAGYWNQPEKTARAFTEDGWLRTGDLGSRSRDGYFTLKGRAKDLIISGGLNVYPPEVELALMTHADVAACAVIGCPDAEWGELVVAVIVLAPGAAPTADEIRAHCRDRLAAYKAPRRVVFAAELPRNALGKAQKALLRGTACE